MTFMSNFVMGMCTILTFDGEFIDHFGHSDLFILKIDEVMFYSSSNSCC